MVGYRQVSSTSSAFNSGSSGQQRNGFHLSRKPFFSFNNSNFKAQNQLGSDPPRASHMHSNLENGLDNDVKFRMIVKRIGAGLENLGNTCFLNSVLQCLTYTEPLVAYLMSGNHQKTCHIVGFCALCSIQNHVVRALQSTGRIVAPKDLVSNLRRISRNFRSSRQEDAHEYMVHLLESMHKCCLPSGVPYESPSAHEKSLVHNIFGGCLRSQVKCTQCSYGSNKFDPFLDLSLEIVKADSLHKALNHFTSAEMLDGGERQYMCQQCKQKVRALKQLTIDKAPSVLTIHLKRFGSHISGQKIDKKIHFGQVLNLKPYVSETYEGELKYTLYGVLVHAGWSTHSGHYYCFVRTSSGIWYSLDDNRVRQVTERTVLEQKAYMLFYVRDGMDFGAGNIVSAVQSQKMGPTAMPNGSSCTSTADYRHLSIDNAGQKEKSISTTVGKGLSSTSTTNQVFQKKDDGKSVIGGIEKDKILTTLPQKRSGDKDSDGSLQNRLPAKKLRSADDSDAVVHQNLPVVPLSENHLSKEDLLKKPESKDLSQPTIESKENEPVLKANVQHSTLLRKCTGVEPLADNAVLKILEPVTSLISDDKTLKRDLVVSVVKTVAVVDIVQKANDEVLCAPENTVAKESVQMSQNAGQPNDTAICEDGLSNPPIHSLNQKPKKKPLKYNFPSMHLGTRILYGASLTLQKRKKHRKVKKNKQKLDPKNLMDEKSGPSTSHTAAAVEVQPKISKKRRQRGSKKSIDKPDKPSACENSVSELMRRAALGNTAVTGDNQLFESELQQQNLQTSHIKANTITCNGTADKPTGNAERTADERCNGVELTSSQIAKAHNTASFSIGHVADARDEEYDCGKRKKVRTSEDTFGGPQKIATKAKKLDIATKAAKLKGKHKQYNPANQPFRI